MKSMILKDLYTISQNMKSLVFILIFLAVALIPTSEVLGYVFAASIICSTMVVTTFHFDEACGWTPYALVMPVTRKELVAAKYIALLVFTAFGALLGFVLGAIGGVVTGKMPLSLEAIGQLFLLSLAALTLGMVVGGMSIPLVIKYGPERGRLMLLISVLVPGGIVAAVCRILNWLGAAFTDKLVITLLCASALAALVWDLAMYKIGCRIFEKQEL